MNPPDLRRLPVWDALQRPIAAVALLALAPVFAVLWLAVVLTSGRPFLYGQVRPGLNGRPFKAWKIRTMRNGADKDVKRQLGVTLRDPMVTPIGRILRDVKLDELPQLWNVLRGDMSVIGPRPTVRSQVDAYSPRQRRRLEVRPGLTGWAQIHGRATVPWPERIELDVWYVDNRSPRIDLQILLRTPLALFGGTYKGETGGWQAPASDAAPPADRPA